MARNQWSMMMTALVTSLTLATGCPDEPDPDQDPQDQPNNQTSTMNNDPAGNTPPVAEAGENVRAIVGEPVTLNGSSSYDEDGDLLTVQWRLITTPKDSQAELEDATDFRVSLTPDLPGDYQLGLVVHDGQTESEEDRVYVRARVSDEPDPNQEPNQDPAPDNRAPVAEAGEAETYFLDQSIRLDGTGSEDPDGDELTFAWTLTSRPADSQAELEGADTARPTLTPDVPGPYEAELIVSDGELTSEPDAVLLTVMNVTPTNTPPVADAGADQDAVAGQEVILDGTASADPDGDELTFAWAIASKPEASQATLTGETTPTPTLTPDLGGRYLVELVVDDGTDASAPDTVAVEVTSEDANAPVAVLPQMLSARVGQPLELDGSQSYDDDDDALSWRWRLLEKPPGSLALLEGATTATPTLTPDLAGTYRVQLVVEDQIFSSNPAVVTIEAVEAGPLCILISEYVEGSSDNKALELYNCSDQDADLGRVGVCLASNDGADCDTTVTLSGTLGPAPSTACATRASRPAWSTRATAPRSPG